MMNAARFLPPEAPASFYVGEVMHHRMKPRVHRFTYQVFTLLIDLMRLEEANRLSRFFSIGRLNLLGFNPGDHGPLGRQGDPLGEAKRLLAEAGVLEAPQRLLLLCYPRVLGLVFNPIATYFAYGAGDRLIAVIYEVRNTFGERHSYVAPVRAGELTEAGLRQHARKLFYVSPFMDLSMTYHFRLRPPGAESLALRIHETDAEGPILAATFSGHRRDITDSTCLALLARMPMHTAKVVAGIHFEALRLWVKGLKLRPRPKRPPAASLDGTFLRQDSVSGGSRDHG
jgi:DUF1365 family protein